MCASRRQQMPPPPPSLRRRQTISCSCCDCRRRRHHHHGRQPNHKSHNQKTDKTKTWTTDSSDDDDERSTYFKPKWQPSTLYNAHLEEKKQFFEHLNDARNSSTDSDDDERLEYSQQRYSQPKQQTSPHNFHPPANKWRKPQQRQSNSSKTSLRTRAQAMQKYKHGTWKDGNSKQIGLPPYTSSDDEQQHVVHFKSKLHPSTRPNNGNLDEKKRFFEHVNEAERLKYYTAHYTPPEPQQPPPHNNNYPLRSNWRKPQQRKWHSNYASKESQNHPRVSVAPVPPTDQRYQHLLYQEEEVQINDEGRSNDGFQEEEEDNPEHHQNFNQSINPTHFHNQNHKYPHSDNDYPHRLRTLVDEISIHNPRPVVSRKPRSEGGYSSRGEHPPYEVVTLWKSRYEVDDGGAGEIVGSGSQQDSSLVDNLTPPHEEADFKWSLPSHQTSRNYLKQRQIVTNTKAEWEKKIASDPEFRNSMLGGRRITPVTFTPLPRLEDPQLSPVHYPLSTGLVSEYHRTTKHITVNTENTDEKSEQEQNEVDQHHHQQQYYEYEVTARHSHSSPMLNSRRRSSCSPEKVNPKAKTHPRQGKSKYPHPEYEHLNLSSMKIPDKKSN